MKRTLVTAFAVTILIACNNNTGNDKTTDIKTTNKETTPGKSYVTAEIDGKAWKSDGDNVMVTYNTPLDVLSVHTKDNDGKKNIIFDMPDFSKIKAGNYSSSNASGKGISVLDTDKADGEEMDLYNYPNGGDVVNCIQVTTIKDLGNDNQLVEGTFASEMVHSYDGASKPKVQLTNGKFSVVYNTKKSY